MTRIEAWTLASALALHIGALAIARSVPDINLLAREHAREMDLIDVEIEKEEIVEHDDIVPEDEVEPENMQAGAIVDSPSTPDRRRDRRRNPSSTGGTGDPDAENPAGEGPVADGGPGGQEEEWTTPDGGGWTPPGMGANGPIYNDKSLFDMPQTGPKAPTKAPKGKKADRGIANKVINDAVLAEDKKLGLDFPAGGTIASLFKSAVQGSDTPAEATASFAVALGPGGKVKSVTFVSASAGSESQWKAVAATVKAALASRKLTLSGHYVKGANVSVRVLSKMQMPSGNKVGAGLDLSLTQKFDVADIGARPVRVVSASHNATPVE
ncbi:MAG: hypothetical protein HOV80_09525 [Polyangiaceae bacterium]|nr:hypothetical protein [Polyangiaceae bacterium]